MTRLRAGTVAMVLMLISSAGPPAAAASDGSAQAADLEVVTGARVLTATEVRTRDITTTDAGVKALQSAAADGAIDPNRRPYRVFAFDEQRVIVDAKTPMTVTQGLNREGETVYDVVPAAIPVAGAASAGYVVPPSSAWVYNTDGSYITSVGTWKQTVFWTITAAWNYKACSTCTAYQYFRIYGKMQAATITGAQSNEGFKRAWIEFDNNGGWGGSPAEFEIAEPEESYAGKANQTFTVGFGSSFNANIGIPPVSVGGGSNTTYGGSMTKSSENWHPVIRTEIASGGVQWCRYESAEFTGTKVISTRVGIRQAVNAQLGGWNILKGMEDFTSRCPSQI